MRLFYIPILLLFVGLAGSAQAQTTSQTSFGKNRVQYHHQFDDWLLYETEHFTTYWYGDARNVAQATLQTAELDFPAVQQVLEHQTTERIELLVFADLTDLKQSNIGEDDVFQLRAGETKVVGNKIFVYFDGNHHHLRTQIREGVAGVLLNSMLFGSNIQEIVQNAVLLNLPGWYTNGLTAYCGEEWSTDLDNRLRDLLLTGKYPNFDKLAKEHPRLAGHAFWHYIALHFGRGTISNLLYLTRINRSIDAGFLYVLGGGYRRTTDALLEYYAERYREETKNMRAPEKLGAISVKNRKNLPLSQLKVSPDGRHIAWVSNDIGRWRVWVQDLQTGKRRRLYKGGARNAQQATDYNYPQLAWTPDNQRLAVLTETRDQAHLTTIDLKTRKRETDILSPEYQRVFSMDYLNPNDLLLSAASKGFSDLFIYRTRTRQTERITQDFWDDLDAVAVRLDGHRGVLFSSNRLGDSLKPQRLDTLLPLGRFDVFYLDLDNRDAGLVRVTKTPLADERAPLGIDSSYFTFLTDESGISNRKSGYLEPYTAYYQTVIYLKEGAEAKAFDPRTLGEWTEEQVRAVLEPLDTVMKYLDSSLIDNIKVFPVIKKRPVTWNQSNNDRSIDQQHLSARAGVLVESIVREKKQQFFRRKLQPTSRLGANLTRYRTLTLRDAGLPIPPPPSDNELQDGQSLLDSTDQQSNPPKDSILPGWRFQVADYLLQPAPPGPPSQDPKPAATETPAPEQEGKENADTALKPTPSDRPTPTKPTDRVFRPLMEFGRETSLIRFYPSKIVPYRLKFRTDYVSTTMDNNLLFEGLDLYNDSLAKFRTPPPGILLRANFKDLLENYVIEAGFRLPTTFNGAEYYLWFDDKKKRLDKRAALYRRSSVNAVNRPRPNNTTQEFQVRTTTFLAQYEVRYPIDVFFSLRALGSVRQDKNVTLSTNRESLDRPDQAEQRAAVRLSAVYDNTVDVDLNLKTGTRTKLWVEAVKRFEFNTQPNWSFKLNEGFMTIVGIDARHYQRLDKRSILALRMAGATSFGSEKMLYLLGGVDNWIFPKFNDNIPLPSPQDFAYRTLAANVRGFKQNIRNGNNYALFNAELRVPIFKYFSKKPVMGNFWRNFQLTGFFDAGTAWQGGNPYHGDNPLNTVFLYGGPVNQPNVIVKVNYFRDPLVAGYGFGVRTLLFGMYLRADYAWGIETRVVQKPLLHFALGTDF